MAPTLIQAKDPVKNLEQHLNHELAPGKSNPSWANIATQLEKVRSYCASAVLENIEAAKAKGIDDERMWAAHRNVNDRFRAEYTLKPKSKQVERRKLDSEYLRYIKASQKFYRGYIYNLSVAYGGIRELQEVAEKVERGHSGEHVPARRATADVRDRVLRSCCTSLSQLGDLSRYRETQLPSKDKGPDWSHAIGYYELAQAILPRSGHAQNQMAVVALADNNSFRSVYHLYLALLAMEPHPNALANLKKALYKIRSLRENGRLFQENGPGRSVSHNLRMWYLQVISNCFHGKTAPQQDELEREYVQHLESFISNGLQDVTLYKITLINIAAGHHARKLFESEGGSGERMNSFLQFLCLNVKTLTVILKAFEKELRATENSKLTPIIRKLLPSLRLYSAWLMEYGRIVAGADQQNAASLQQPFWEAYARCLTLMVSVFPSASQLPEVSYLLAEDHDTLGFSPLHSVDTADIWFDEKGQRKASRPRQQEGASINELEDLTRVRYVLRVGLHLAVQSTDAPLKFSGSDVRFYYEAAQTITDSTTGTLQHSGASIAPAVGPQVSAAPFSPAADEDVRAARMVDDLVADELDVSALPSVNRQPLPTQPRSSQTIEEIMRAVPALTRPRSSASPRGTPSPHQLSGSGTGSHAQSPIFGPSTLPRGSLRLQNQRPNVSRPGSGGYAIITPKHGRVNSNESNVSRGSIWATDVPGSLRSPLGNGTFGLANEDAIDDSSMSSSLLFGTGNGPWSATTPTHPKEAWAAVATSASATSSPMPRAMRGNARPFT